MLQHANFSIHIDLFFKMELTFRKFSTKQILHELFDSFSPTTASGIDNLSYTSVKKNIENEIKIIDRKFSNGNYKFTKYKLKLISKGRGKAPREISIPTIRDRIVLKVMFNYLSQVYEKTLNHANPQNVVRTIKNNRVLPVSMFS